VEVEGKKVPGYLSATSLAGLEEFNAARRQASADSRPILTRSQVEQLRETVSPDAPFHLAIDALQKGRAADVEPILTKSGAPSDHRDVAVIRSAAWLQLNQPERALGLLEAALRRHQRDPQLLALAGMASYKLDDARSAQAYWKESLDLHPDPEIEDMLRRVQREMGADKSTAKTYGSRFLLRYDGAVADPETARSLVAALEEEFSRISFQLGCRAEERLVVIVQSLQSYRDATGAPEWNGGQFDGRIRIPMDRARTLDPRTRQTLAHELVHACLANLGRWPTWVHEGLAQKLSRGSPPPDMQNKLRELARAGRLPKLASLGNGWFRLSAEEARLRYAVAWAAAELLFRNQGAVAARNLLNDPESLPQVTAGLDRALPASLP
jgi:tetratricopeptide (TPR) repeat protein